MLGLGVSLADSVLRRPPAAAGGYGPELVQNGGFDDASGWTLNTASAQISGGTFNATGGIGNKRATRTANDTITEGTYLVSFDVTARSAGSVNVWIGGSARGTARSAVGSYSEVVTVLSPSDQTVGLNTASSSNLSADNVSVKKVLS